MRFKIWIFYLEGGVNLGVIKSFLLDEDGISTVEVVIIIAILVVVALLFKEKLVGFVDSLFDKVLNPGKIEKQLTK